MANARKIRSQEEVSDSNATPDLVDLSLVRKAQDGDQEAFAALWRQIESRVTQQVNRLLRSNDDVPDLVQEIAIKIWQSIRQYRSESKFSTWLYPIVMRRCFDYWKKFQRKDSKNEPLDDQIGAEQPEHLHEGIEAREIAQRVYDRLKQEDQQIIELVYDHGESNQTVASRLGVKVDHVAYVLGVFLDKAYAEDRTHSSGKRVMSHSKAEKVLHSKKKSAVGS